MENLARKAASSGAKIFMMSHMRGHIANMDRAKKTIDAHGITAIGAPIQWARIT